MTPFLPPAASLILAYIIGSIPVAVILTRAQGIDIFAVGTGNPGASNVFREVGKWQGATVFLLDIAKGIIPVYIARWIGTPDILLPIVAATTIVGVWFPVFLRFRGGAGLAAGVGGVMALQGVWAIATIAAGVALLATFRSGPHAAIGLAALALGIALITGPDWNVILGIALVGAMMLARLVVVEIPRDRRGDRPDSQHRP